MIACNNNQLLDESLCLLYRSSFFFRISKHLKVVVFSFFLQQVSFLLAV